MKRVIMVIGAGSAAITALGRKMAETVGEIRDLAEIGPRSIDSLQHDASVEEMQLMQYEAQRDEPESCPACERSIQFAVAQSDRIRDILGDRNDNSRTVVDLIDELCEELDRGRQPSKICPRCYIFNGAKAESCRECGEPMT
jgi:ribosomal protein L40E